MKPFDCVETTAIEIVLTHLKLKLPKNLSLTHHGGARGVMVIVVGNGHSDSSSNPGREWLHFT